MAGIGTDIEIQGLEELQKKLKPDELLGRSVKDLLNTAALSLEREAKSLSPVDTGRLRSSITHSISGDPIPLWAKVGTNVEYAEYVEYGTSKWSGKAFMRPALEKLKGRIDGLLKKAGKMIEERFSA